MLHDALIIREKTLGASHPAVSERTVATLTLCADDAQWHRASDHDCDYIFLKTFEKIMGKFFGVVVPRVSAVHTDDQCWIKSWALGAAAQGT